MGEFIDVKKSFSVGSRIIYNRKKGKLNIGSRPNILSGLFGIFFILSASSFVSEVKQILGTEFALND